MPLALGTRLGNIEVVGPLGAGGMGEVYRGKDTKLDREVAIKVLPATFAQHPERLARFEREAKVLASLNHPNPACQRAHEHQLFVRASRPWGPARNRIGATTNRLVTIYLTGPSFGGIVNSWKLRHPILLKTQSLFSLARNTALTTWCLNAGPAESLAQHAEVRRLPTTPRTTAGSALAITRNVSSL